MAEAPTEFMTTPGADEAARRPRRTPAAAGSTSPICRSRPRPRRPARRRSRRPRTRRRRPRRPRRSSPRPNTRPSSSRRDAGHTTEERHAIAEQPTEFFDVESEIGPTRPPAEAPSPSDEEILEVEAAEPKLAPVEPATEIHASRTEAPADDVAADEEEDDDFWNEQRLSDELDQALEAPLPEEAEEEPPAPPAAEEPIAEAPAPPEQSTEPEQSANYDPDTGHEDVLEDTPDFLEDAPEDDELWFEQKPPKDFDFDD